MAVDGKFVIDAVAHAFDLRPENEKGLYARQMNEANFRLQEAYLPTDFRLTRDRYFQAFTADALVSALFVESDTDVAMFHTIPSWGVWNDYSPISVGMEIRERYPGRMLCYGAVSPLEGKKALDDVARQAEEWDIRGVKMYPVDFIDGEMRAFTMDDREMVYPVLEKCREVGIKTIAIHKAMPLGGAPMDPFRPGDVDYAAIDFPDLNFEIVHGGYAFLEETCFQIARFDNVYVNLECNTALILKHPRAFAKMIGELLLNGPDKLFWATGAMWVHPAPVLEAFAKFEMPEDMMEDYGYPQLTDEIKADILHGNFARMHGLDVEAMARAIENDELAQLRAAGGAKPWSKLPAGDPSKGVAHEAAHA
jgi:predicted TIM-barrel fold metal-dependent hydrolase